MQVQAQCSCSEIATMMNSSGSDMGMSSDDGMLNVTGMQCHLLLFSVLYVYMYCVFINCIECLNCTTT